MSTSISTVREINKELAQINSARIHKIKDLTLQISRYLNHQPIKIQPHKDSSNHFCEECGNKSILINQLVQIVKYLRNKEQMNVNEEILKNRGIEEKKKQQDESEREQYIRRLRKQVSILLDKIAFLEKRIMTLEESNTALKSQILDAMKNKETEKEKRHIRCYTTCSSSRFQSNSVNKGSVLTKIRKLSDSKNSETDQTIIDRIKVNKDNTSFLNFTFQPQKKKQKTQDRVQERKRRKIQPYVEERNSLKQQKQILDLRITELLNQNQILRNQIHIHDFSS